MDNQKEVFVDSQKGEIIEDYGSCRRSKERDLKDDRRRCCFTCMYVYFIHSQALCIQNQTPTTQPNKNMFTRCTFIENSYSVSNILTPTLSFFRSSIFDARKIRSTVLKLDSIGSLILSNCYHFSVSQLILDRVWKNNQDFQIPLDILF